MKNLFIALTLVAISQSITYIQLQGQFFSEWIKNHPFLVSLVGVPISYLLIEYTKRSADYFDGAVWPGRLIGFAVGIIAFAVLSNVIFNETLSAKTIVCICLAAAIVAIQIFC